MAGKKDKVVVAVISELTDNQAAHLTKDIIKAKQKYAPRGRGTVATGFKEQVGAMLQGKSRKNIEIEKKNGKEIDTRRKKKK